MVDFNMGPVGVMPSFGVTPRDVGWGMVGAATAMGVPGFSMASPAFPLIAGTNWSSGSSGYWGTPGFRGVADIAIASNNYQTGWSTSYGLSGGLGLFGIGAPAIGSGGYYIGPGPGFLDTNMIVMSYLSSANTPQQQQPAGPAPQAAPPQPATAPQGGTQVDAKGEGAPAAARGRRGGRGARATATPLTATEYARLQSLENKKNSSIPFWGGLNAAETAEYNGLKGRPAPVAAPARRP